MTEQEREVLRQKYAGKLICQMNDAELLSGVTQALNRIHVITGWTIPEDKAYIKILAEEFALKLKQDFPQMNFSEVVFAFRRNGMAVQNWGKSMNLQLINEVLCEYMAERQRLSEMEERAKQNPVQRIYTQEELDNLHRADVEAFYQRCLNGVKPPAELPEYFRQILIKDGLLHQDSDDLHAFFAYWIERGYENVYIKTNANDTNY